MLWAPTSQIPCRVLSAELTWRGTTGSDGLTRVGQHRPGVRSLSGFLVSVKRAFEFQSNTIQAHSRLRAAGCNALLLPFRLVLKRRSADRPTLLLIVRGNSILVSIETVCLVREQGVLGGSLRSLIRTQRPSATAHRMTSYLVCLMSN